MAKMLNIGPKGTGGVPEIDQCLKIILKLHKQFRSCSSFSGEHQWTKFVHSIPVVAAHIIILIPQLTYPGQELLLLYTVLTRN